MIDEAGMPMLVEAVTNLDRTETVRIADNAAGYAKAFAGADGMITYRRVEPPIESRRSAVDEKAELDERIGKLCAFLKSDAYRALPDTDRFLLERQISHMRDYAHILFMRVARFG
jgi:hypothetical protein